MENGSTSQPPAPSRSPRWSPRRFRHWEHPLFHLALLLLTFGTTTLSGAFFYGQPPFSHALLNGLRFSVPIMLILGVHEMGHYLMCRRYGLPATRPYFLPAPPLLTPFGTFGAVIRIKEPIREKKVLIDVGAAGPVAGFLTSLPFLFYGVTRATPVISPAAPDTSTLLFGYPLLVRLAQDWTGAARYTSAGVHEDPTFMAAWLGLLVTALNLLPIGQLDGGHILRAAIGRRQPFVSYGVVGLTLVAALRGGYVWAFMALLMTVLAGAAHPPVDDDDQPLTFGRQLLALACLAIFLVCFTMVPIHST
jgi:membrane-associated protease RseP (regulator of RpoE activity)